MIYTIGYTGLNREHLRAAAQQVNATVVDVRFSPGSINPVWSRKQLSEFLGERYLHIKDFGNVNYKGGPIQLQDAAAGFEIIQPYLERGVILMCACKHHGHCHRLTVADYLHQRTALEVIHWSASDLQEMATGQLRLF